MSRRYTFTADRNTASAAENIKMAAIAGTSSQMRPQSGRCQKANMNATITMPWKRKNTRADPTEASGRISLGKATFFTIPPLPTTVEVAPRTPVRNRFQTSVAENM